MAKASNKTETADDTGVKPVVALCSIVYGAQKTVEPGTIFTPVSAEERTELVTELKAARNLNEAEAALFDKTGPGTVVEVEHTPEPAAIPEPPEKPAAEVESPLG
jgi:hypothetical protein